MTHTKEPWALHQPTKKHGFVRNSDGDLIAMFGSEKYPLRAVSCVNTLADIADSDAWVKAAKRLSDGVHSRDGYKDMIEAVLDMKAAEGGE